MKNLETLRRADIVVRTSSIKPAEKIFGVRVQEVKNNMIGERPTGLNESEALVIEEELPGRGSVYTAAIGRLLNGKTQNKLTWEVAPSQAFLLDKEDYIKDHTRLLTNDAEFENIRRMHEGLGKSWRVFRNYGVGQLVAIQQPEESREIGLYPVVRWWKQGEKRKFIYSPFMHSAEGREKLLDFLGVRDVNLAESMIDPALGLQVLAFFSPDQRRHWGQTDRLHVRGNSNVLGTTQTPLLVIKKENHLIYSEGLVHAEKEVSK